MLPGWYLCVGADGRQVVIHVHHPRRQVLEVPGVPLYFRDGDALLGLSHQDAAQNVAALLGRLHLGGYLVVHLQDPLHSRQATLSTERSQ